MFLGDLSNISAETATLVTVPRVECGGHCCRSSRKITEVVPKIIIFLHQKKIYRIKVPKKQLIKFWKKKSLSVVPNLPCCK